MKKLIVILITVSVCLSLTAPIFAAEDPVVYVCSGGQGNGTTKRSPLGSLEEAYRVLLEKSDIDVNADASGTIVICGPLRVSDHFNYDGALMHKGKVIVTSSCAGEDFRASSNARLEIYAPSKSALSVRDEHRFVLGGPTVFENLIIDRVGKTEASLTIYASTELYIAESVEVVNTNWSRSYTESVRGLSDNEIKTIILSAHRGYQPMGPENSILSFEAAGKLGFDYIETDVVMTADGELVCIHDDTLDRTTNGSGKVTAMTYAEILKYRIDTAAYGFDLSSAYPSKLYVPTFREYLEICKKYGSKPFIELKSGSEDVIKKTIDMSLEYFAPEEIVVSSSSLTLLKTSYGINRDVFCHLIWGDQTDAGYENSIQTLEKMTDSKGKVNAGIAFNITNLSNKVNYGRAKSWIDKAKSAGLLTCLRAADDMAEVRFMFELGIDYYPTNTTSPEKLAILREGREGGYSYLSSDGGKLFIRGGRRSEKTDGDISITLLGGIYDFVAPSNAEAESTGKYSVTVGGNAFISRLVAGETAKGASGNRDESVVTVKDNAEIREFYVAGDSCNTEKVIVNIFGGKVTSLSESRGKGGTSYDFTLRVDAIALMPQNVNISDGMAITGTKRLEICSDETYVDPTWNEIVNLTSELETDIYEITETSSAASSPSETTASDSEEKAEREENSVPLAVIPALTAAIAVVVMLCVKKEKEQRSRKNEK